MLLICSVQLSSWRTPTACEEFADCNSYTRRATKLWLHPRVRSTSWRWKMITPELRAPSLLLRPTSCPATLPPPASGSAASSAIMVSSSRVAHACQWSLPAAVASTAAPASAAAALPAPRPTVNGKHGDNQPQQGTPRPAPAACCLASGGCMAVGSLSQDDEAGADRRFQS